MDVDGNKRVFHRLGGPSNANDKSQKVCFHWRAGRCTRRPCPFLHRELPQPHPHSNGYGAGGSSGSSKRHADDSGGFSGRRGRGGVSGGSSNWGRNKVVRKTEKVCNYWVQGNCSYGDNCKYLHGWSLGDSFSLLSGLDGHEKVVTGIALPAGSDKLYTGSADQTLRAWDCQSGQCISVINLGGEVGCMISESPWIFVGIPNAVKAFNIQTAAEQTLSGPAGQVYAILVANGLLFAGTQDGSILAWKYNAVSNCFEPATSLRGHKLAVVTMVAASNRLYSCSMDKTVRVWNLENFQCMQTLTDHTDIVMSVVCWDQFLLSCSLDNTIKVWVATESGNLEVTYTHTEDSGLLTLSGMYDSEAKPVLLCSCNDNTVRFYDLPSFSERGKIFAKQEVRTIQIGPGGLFFYWRWNGSSESMEMVY